MAKPKGHRANKPNDSFGTINNKDLYKFIFISELLIKSKLVKTKDAKIRGIDKSIEKIAADDLSKPRKRAPVIVTPALLAPGINANI